MSKNITNTIDIWAKFDIESVKRELDDKVIEIAKQLEEGDTSRKKLIEQTKEFRKSLTEEQRKLVGSILKSFQVEVDSSSKRTKLMEQVILKLYKQIIDLPDPCPILENSQRLQKKAERVQDLEIENKQLRETLDEYNAEFAEVKNQEVTIKMLKDKIKDLEDKIEQSIQQRVKEKEKELQKFYSDKEEQLQSTQLDLVKKLGDTEARNFNLQSQLQKAHTDLYELKSKQDELLNAKSCEIDLLLQDLDKMNERAANAERLSEQYMQQMTLKQQQQANTTTDELNQQQQLNEMKLNYQTSTLEIELVAKEKEISQLVEDIQKLQMKSNKAREFFETQRLQLEEKLVSRERTLEQLEYELRKKQDYDEIKRELSILKTIEFNLPMDNANETTSGMVTNVVGAPAGTSTEQQQQKPLEILLLEKNRFLQNENTQIKNKLNDLVTKHEVITKEHGNLMKVNLEQKTLIIELEKDLLKLAQNQPATAVRASTSSYDNNLATVIDLEQPDVPVQTPQSPVGSSAFDFNNGTSEQTVDTSLFNIVSSQRERFRLRVQELESETVSNKQQVMFLTNELDRLRSDNVKLYEKIKFLQSMGGKSSLKNDTRRSAESDDFLSELSGSNDDAHVLHKYNNEYEQRLDPFSKFNQREKQKRYVNLKLHDKFTLNFGRFILSSKTARLIFCAYILIIHLLIFGSLYNFAHHEASHRDYSAECSNSFREHMAQVHGLKSFNMSHTHH